MIGELFYKNLNKNAYIKMMTKLRSILGGSLLAAFACLCNAETTKPNIVDTSSDDLGSGDIDCYGQKGADQRPQAPAENKQANSEAKWINLLEGGNLSQWKKWRRGTIESSIGWTVKDGVLSLSKAPEVRTKGGSLTTIKHYQNFELKFEFKISEGGNSGIKYRSLDNLGMEYQILDDVSAKDNKNPKNSAASLYQLVPAPKTKKLKPAGEWNSGRIVANGNQLEHWLNGKKVVSIEFGSEQWVELFKKSKYKIYPDFAKQGGEILLQDHGDDVSFRNLMIRELK